MPLTLPTQEEVYHVCVNFLPRHFRARSLKEPRAFDIFPALDTLLSGVVPQHHPVEGGDDWGRLRKLIIHDNGQ